MQKSIPLKAKLYNIIFFNIMAQNTPCLWKACSIVINLTVKII